MQSYNDLQRQSSAVPTYFSSASSSSSPWLFPASSPFQNVNYANASSPNVLNYPGLLTPGALDAFSPAQLPPPLPPSPGFPSTPKYSSTPLTFENINFSTPLTAVNQPGSPRSEPSSPRSGLAPHSENSAHYDANSHSDGEGASLGNSYNALVPYYPNSLALVRLEGASLENTLPATVAGENTYVDITSLLTIPQKEAAYRLGIPMVRSHIQF